jgi:hypothetical protein
MMMMSEMEIFTRFTLESGSDGFFEVQVIPHNPSHSSEIIRIKISQRFHLNEKQSVVYVGEEDGGWSSDTKHQRKFSNSRVKEKSKKVGVWCERRDKRQRVRAGKTERARRRKIGNFCDNNCE